MAADQVTTVPKTTWTDVVAAKQSIRNEQVKKHATNSMESSLITKVTGINDVEALTLLLEKGKHSAEEIIRAYISK
jgi:hypothetical protein